MKFSHFSFLCIAFLIALLCASCVQSNTHKNIRTAGQYYEGYQLSAQENIYLSEGQWYIKAEKCKVKRHYSILSLDSVDYANTFIKDSFKPSGDSLGTVYLPIDKDIAKSLRNKENTLSITVDRTNRINRHSKYSSYRCNSMNNPTILSKLVEKGLKGRKDYLPSVKEYPVLAAVDNRTAKTRVDAYHKEKEFKQNIAYLGLSKLSYLVVDVPLIVISNTVLYVTFPIFYISALYLDNPY